jgi:acyl carrier protein
MSDRADTQQAVKEFILAEFLAGEDPDELTQETELVSSGILDSVATLRLVTFLEERFGIAVEAHEADEEHLNTLDTIADLVAAKKSGARR